MKSLGLQKDTSFGFELMLWIVTAWLLYALIILDSVDMENAKVYFYRSAAGIALMVIFFGKAIADFIFPRVSSK